MSSIQRQVALDLIASLNAHDYDKLTGLLSEDLTHRFRPASLKGLGKPVRNKQEIVDHLKGAEKILKSFNFQFEPPEDIIQAEDVVILHLFTDGETASGKPYKDEFLFTLRFRGDKIISIIEFMDSKNITDVLAQEGRA